MRHIALALGLFAAALLVLAGCQSGGKDKTISYPTLGTLQGNDARFHELVPSDARIEILAEGFDWSEGPVWVSSERSILDPDANAPIVQKRARRGALLLFSDVPMNTVHIWQEGETSAPVFLKPSGYTGTAPRGGEPGSNGLTLDHQGRLVLCEHGDRRVARLERDGTKTTLASHYEGKRLNSPNDLAYRSNGDLYFTDPPYGLEGNVNDPKKELPFQGVYRVSRDGQLTLLTSDMSRPNGIAFSPDEKTLYVANSDPQNPVWMAFDVKGDGSIENGRVFFDASHLARKGLKGLPDGLKVDRKGNLFATGPGGVLVLSPEGEHLGTINTGQATANCAWGEDGSVLYITADMYLCRIQTSTKGKLAGK